MIKKSKYHNRDSKRAAGGEIAVFKRVLNGLKRAA